MASKNMMYDSPAYVAVLPISLIGTGTGGAGITGVSGQSNKFVAFANLFVKSVVTAATTVGTSTVSSNGVLFYKISNNGTTAVNTTTTTYTMVPTGIAGVNATAVTTAAYMVSHLPPTAQNTTGGIPMLQGDIGYIAKGTDATEVLYAQVEAVIQPLANLTA